MKPHLIATAQVVLSALYIGGYFVMLGLVLMGYIRTPEQWKDVLVALLGVLTAGVGTILAFWFSRQRERVEPQP